MSDVDIPKVHKLAKETEEGVEHYLRRVRSRPCCTLCQEGRKARKWNDRWMLGAVASGCGAAAISIQRTAGTAYG